jgi:hypothetical protein
VISELLGLWRVLKKGFSYSLLIVGVDIEASWFPFSSIQLTFLMGKPRIPNELQNITDTGRNPEMLGANVPNIPISLPATIPVNIPISLPATIPVNIPISLPATIPVNIPISLPATIPVNIPNTTPRHTEEK